MNMLFGQTLPVSQDDNKTKRAQSMSFVAKVGMLTWRALIVNLRMPASIMPPLIVAVFFLLVNNAQLGGVAASILGNQSYIGFILPLSVVSAALSRASIAGQTILTDIERGYFNKLLLTP